MIQIDQKYFLLWRNVKFQLFRTPNKYPERQIIPVIVVVVQLVERLLPKPVIRNSNSVIGIIYTHYELYWKDENKEKEAGNGLFKKPQVINVYLKWAITASFSSFSVFFEQINVKNVHLVSGDGIRTHDHYYTRAPAPNELGL